MNITSIKLRKVSGTMETNGVFWEERLAMPLDVYDEFRDRSPIAWDNQTDDGYKLSAIFVEIETDDGATGRGGRGNTPTATLVAATATTAAATAAAVREPMPIEALPPGAAAI